MVVAVPRLVVNTLVAELVTTLVTAGSDDGDLAINRTTDCDALF